MPQGLHADSTTYLLVSLSLTCPLLHSPMLSHSALFSQGDETK